MKLRGDEARVAAVEAEVVIGWMAVSEVTGVRMGPTLLGVMGEASGMGLKGRLVSGMPAGIVRISLPCWILR